MFTGLVQALGTVSRVEPDGHGGRRLAVVEPRVGPLLTLGESVAVNGACLTVVRPGGSEFHFEAGPETLAKTNLGGLGVGDRVNLERALRVGDPLGGHFVTGHIDVVGAVASRERAGDWETVWFAFPPGWDDLLVPKGSAAVDGVSLTVVGAEPGRLSVMLIPHTQAETTLGFKPAGAAVNLEFDLLAKHVRKLLQNPFHRR